MKAVLLSIGIIPILAFAFPRLLTSNPTGVSTNINSRRSKSNINMADDNANADATPPKTNDDAVNDDTAAAAAAAIDFFALTRSLKTTKRTGWVMRGVHHPESIADHMYRMSLMAMVAASSSTNSLDTNKCIKLALIHDLAESKVGDITPHCGVSDQSKYEMELNTMKEIRAMLGSTMGGDEILNLFKEYEAGVTEEAKLLKDLDKLEMILQAQEYEAEGSHEQSLDQFFSSTEGKWRTEIGKAWAAEIVSRRRIMKKKENES